MTIMDDPLNDLERLHRDRSFQDRMVSTLFKEESIVNFFQIIAELALLLKTYWPELLAAEQAFATGGWPALKAYLLSLIANPPAGFPTAQVQGLVDRGEARVGELKAAKKP